MAENNPQAPKDSTKKDDKGTDSLLDVFTNSDELVESPTSRLSKDLGDVSVYTLLEQTKQLAEEIKLGH